VKDTTLLYLANFANWLVPLKWWPQKTLLKKAYSKSADKIEANLNILEIVKDLRIMKVILANSIMTKKVRKQIEHHKDLLIDLDSSSEYESTDQESEEREENGPPAFDPKSITKNLSKKIARNKHQKAMIRVKNR